MTMTSPFVQLAGGCGGIYALDGEGGVWRLVTRTAAFAGKDAEEVWERVTALRIDSSPLSSSGSTEP